MPSIEPGASSASSIISLLKTIVGAGLLSMPYAFSTDGIVFGVLIILLAAATSGFGLFIQAYVSRYVPKGHATFFNLCSVTYPALSVVFDFAIAVQCFGSALSYLVLVGEIMPTVVHTVPYVENTRNFWVLASAAICVPLSFLKNLDSLKYTSILGLVAIAYMSLLVVIHHAVGDIPQELKGDISVLPISASGIFSTFSIIVFAYTGHQNMFSIINEAADKSLVNLFKITNTALLEATTLFLIVGSAGYLTFGNKVAGNIILLYPGGWSTTVGRLCIVFMVIFSFPLMLHPARISVNNIVYWVRSNLLKPEPQTGESAPLLDPEHEEEVHGSSRNLVVPFSETSFIVITVALLLLGYILAVTINSFAFVLAVVGATGSTAISFILPGLFGHKLIGSELDDPSTVEVVLKNLSLALTFWGFAVMFICLYTTLTT